MITPEQLKEIQKLLDKEKEPETMKKHFQFHANGVNTYTGDVADVLTHWIEKVPTKAEEI
jgi:hypothetical protein